MARKITERERLLSYALKATDEQLKEAIETFTTVLNSRTPAERKERKKKAVSDAVAGRPFTPPVTKDEAKKAEAAAGIGVTPMTGKTAAG